MPVANAAGWPCMEDLHKFCGPNAKPGPESGECMMKHHDELSAGCKAHMEEMKKEMDAKMAPCKADKEKLCSAAEQKEITYKCLQAHKDKVSPACKTAWEDLKKWRNQMAAHGKGGEQGAGGK
jgi:hypothetical protein